MAVSIRDATFEDRHSINLLDNPFPSSAGNSIADFTKDQFSVLLENGPSMGVEWIVADGEDGIVGFATSLPRNTPVGIDGASRSGTLSRISVAHASQRSGIGAALLSEIQSRLSRRGTALVTAHIPTDAIKFYEARGWKVLDPSRGIGWIETPSYDLWEQARKAIGSAGAGPRRAMSMLRAEQVDGDPGFDNVAYVVLDPTAMSLVFEFEKTEKQSNISASLHLVREADRDPSTFALLPADVSRTLMDLFLEPVLGRARADELRRSRR